jgi:hypothetical protein
VKFKLNFINFVKDTTHCTVNWFVTLREYIHVSVSRMSVAQGRVFGPSSSRKGLINACPSVSHAYMGILRLLTELFRINGNIFRAAFR